MENNPLNGLQVLHREDYNMLFDEVECKRNWKIGKYTYHTAPRSFYLWALKQPTKSKNLQQFIQWYKLCQELENSIDGGDSE